MPTNILVVIDTNVWISAALIRNTAPALITQRVLERALPVFSNETFNELETRLWKPKFDRYISRETRQRLLHDINACAYWVGLKEEITAKTWCRDNTDDKFIHTALTAGANWLITGDQDLLDIANIPELKILTPSDVLKLPEFL